MGVLTTETFIGRDEWSTLVLKYLTLAVLFLFPFLNILKQIKGRFTEGKTFRKFFKMSALMYFLQLVSIVFSVGFLVIFLVNIVASDIKPDAFLFMHFAMIISTIILLLWLVLSISKQFITTFISKIAVFIALCVVYAFFFYIVVTADQYSYMSLSFVFLSLNTYFLYFFFTKRIDLPKITMKKLLQNNLDIKDLRIKQKESNGWFYYFLSVVVLVVYSIVHHNIDKSGAKYTALLTSVMLLLFDISIMLFPTNIYSSNPAMMFAMFIAIRFSLVMSSYNYVFIGHSIIFFFGFSFLLSRIVGEIIRLKKKNSVDTIINFARTSLLRSGKQNNSIIVYILFTIIYLGDVVLGIVKPNWISAPEIKMIDSSHNQWEFLVGSVLLSGLLVLWYITWRYFPSFHPTKKENLEKKTGQYKNFWYFYIFAQIISIIIAIPLFIITHSYMIIIECIAFFPLIVMGRCTLVCVQRMNFSFKAEHPMIRLIRTQFIRCTIAFVSIMLVSVIVALVGLDGVLYWSTPLFLPLSIVLGGGFVVHLLYSTKLDAFVITCSITSLISLLIWALVNSMVTVSAGIIFIVYVVTLFTLWRTEAFAIKTVVGVQMLVIGVLSIIGAVIGSMSVRKNALFQIGSGLSLLLVFLLVRTLRIYFVNDHYIPVKNRPLAITSSVGLVILSIIIGMQGEGIFWGTTITMTLFVLLLILVGLAEFPLLSSNGFHVCYTNNSVLPLLEFDVRVGRVFDISKYPLFLFGGLVLVVAWSMFAMVFLKPLQVSCAAFFIAFSLILYYCTHLKLLLSIKYNEIEDVVSRPLIDLAIEKSVGMLNLETDTTSKALNIDKTKSQLQQIEDSESNDLTGLVFDDVYSIDDFIIQKKKDLNNTTVDFQRWYIIESIHKKFKQRLDFSAVLFSRLFFSGISLIQEQALIILDYVNQVMGEQTDEEEGQSYTIDDIERMSQEERQKIIEHLQTSITTSDLKTKLENLENQMQNEEFIKGKFEQSINHEVHKHEVRKMESNIDSGLNALTAQRDGFISRNNELELKISDLQASISKLNPDDPSEAELINIQLIQMGEFKNLRNTVGQQLDRCLNQIDELHQKKSNIAVASPSPLPLLDMEEEMQRVRDSEEKFEDDFVYDFEAEDVNCTMARFSDMYEISGEISFGEGDPIQSEHLGVCYLITAFTLLKTNPQLVEQVFRAAIPDKGYYRVVFKNGEHEITVDDRLPVDDDGKLVLSRCSVEENPWVSILEKAYAKLYGSADRIQKGVVCHALADMIPNSFGEIIHFKDVSESFVTGLMWKQIREYFSSGFLVALGSFSSDVSTKDGIQSRHAYAVLSLVEIGQTKLLKLRNPLGGYEYTGNWSDVDRRWTPRLLKKLGHTLDVEDGEFFIAYEDITKYFRNMYVTMVFNSEWNQVIINSEWRGQSAGGCSNYGTFRHNPQFALTIDEPGEVYVVLRQEDARLTGKKHVAMGFSVHIMDASHDGRIIESRNEILCSEIAYRREIIGHTMIIPSKGNFLIVPFTFEPSNERSFTLTVISKQNVSLRSL
ncbi:hypothetical protein PCE1_003602 [Barthelona sp. PCE]